MVRAHDTVDSSVNKEAVALERSIQHSRLVALLKSVLHHRCFQLHFAKFSEQLFKEHFQAAAATTSCVLN